jgi:hypothetical protein
MVNMIVCVKLLYSLCTFNLHILTFTDNESRNKTQNHEM